VSGHPDGRAGRSLGRPDLRFRSALRRLSIALKSRTSITRLARCPGRPINKMCRVSGFVYFSFFRSDLIEIQAIASGQRSGKSKGQVDAFALSLSRKTRRRPHGNQYDDCDALSQGP